MRYEVRRALNTSHVLEDPTLAAAVIAVARRGIARVRWLFIASIVLGLAAAVGIGVLPGDQTVWIVIALFGIPLVGRVVQAMSRAGAQGAVDRHLAVLERHGGATPPPGPVRDAQARRGAVTYRRLRVGIALGVSTVLIILAGSIAWSDYRVGRRLTAAGVETNAEVVRFNDGSGRSGLFTGNRWVVRFEREGQPVEARIVTGDIEGSEGETIPILYDPDDPSIARHAEDPMGRRWRSLGAALALVAVFAIYALVVLWQRRSYRAASMEASQA